MNMSSHDDGSDSEVDIYGDLPQVQNHEEVLVKLEESKKQLEDEVENLKEQLDTLLKKNSLLESKCKALSTNISSLYKTASAEIERKDRMISELRKEKDSIIFRRDRKDLVKKNYTTNEHDQQVGEDTPDRSLHEESQYTCIAIESTYENESDKIDYQSKYQHNIPACNNVQEYDTIFNKRQKEKADRSEIKNKNPDFMKGTAYTSDKSDLASSKTKSSKSVSSKTNIKYTLCTNNNYKECNTDTHGLKHGVESLTSSEEQNIENISRETVPSNQSVSQALKNVTSNSKPQSQLKTLAKHQSISEKSTSYFTSPQNTKATIPSTYSDCDKELKCKNNNESKITVQTSNEVISKRVNSTVLNTNANIFQFKLSEHCDFKRQRKCRIKHLSSATKEGKKIMINCKSDSSEDYRGFSRSEEIDAVTLKENSDRENMDINKTNEICISSCYVNDSDRSTNAKRKRPGTIIENLENKFEIDKGSNVNDRNNLCSIKDSAGISDKTDKLLDPEISINIDKNRDHKNDKEEASCCMHEQEEEKSDNYTIGSEMYNVESKYSKSKYKETGDFTKSEKISIHFHDDIKNISQNPISESKNSWHHERHEISNHYKNNHKWYGFSQMSNKEKNRKLVRMSKRDESFKSGHQSFEDDREKFSSRKNFFKGRCQNSATKTRNVKERKQSSVLREPNAEIKKENSKKLRLSKKISTQDEMNRYVSDSKYDKTVTRSKCLNIDNDKTCNFCKLKNCECKTGFITETEVKGLIDLQEHMLCKQDDSVCAGSLCAQEQKNKLEPVEAKNTCSPSNEEIQMMYSSIEKSHSDKNIKHFSDSSQIKIASPPHNKVTNEDNIKKKISLQNLGTKISSKSPVIFEYEDKIKSQIDGERNCSLKITQECFINTKIVDGEISVNSQKETEKCKIHTETMKEVKKSPIPTFNVKRRSRTYKLEDSRVVSVNIIPPKSEHK